MNRVSKSMFLKYLRCPRSAFFESELSLVVREFKDTLSHLSEQEERTLLQEKFKEKVLEVLEQMKSDLESDDEEEDDDENLDLSSLLKEDKLLAIMNETFFKIEQFSTVKINQTFGGSVTSGRREGDQVYGQKILNLFDDGFNFYTFSDAFQEDEKTIRIIETKSTTSRKFLELGYKEKGEFFGVFTETPEGNLVLLEEVDATNLTDKYYKQRAKLFDRNGDCGRYVYDLAWQRYVYEKSQGSLAKYTEYYLAILNSKYKYDGRKDEHGANLYDPNQVIVLVDLTKITEEIMPQLEKDFELVMKRISQPQGQVVKLEKQKCLWGKGYRQCPWFNICKKDNHVDDHNSIFVYLGSHHGFLLPGTKDRYYIDDLVAMNITKALEVDYEWLNTTQKIQYRVLESGIPYINKAFMRNLIKDYQYPIYHLDFETMNYPIPKFKGEKPYQQSVFQFSIHVERAPGQVDQNKDHYEFLAYGKEDEREALIQAMIEAIPNDGKGIVMAYNQGFEKGRLKELAALFPKYSRDLMAIHDRVVDLMHVIKPNKEMRELYGPEDEPMPNISYYDEGLQRSYSIKKVLPIFAPQLNYALLEEVHNGTDAQMAYMKQSFLTGEELEKTRTNMLKYCKQDTWAMVEILQSLRALIGL